MKKWIVCFLIYMTASNVFAQDVNDCETGFELVAKSAEQLRKHNYKKAEKYLNHAKETNFADCGANGIKAQQEIKLAEAQILIGQKKYDKALTILETAGGCNIGVNCSARDSLKIVALINKHGKQKVKEAFQKVTDVTFTNFADNNTSCWVMVNEFNYKFSFLLYVSPENTDHVTINAPDKNFHTIAKDQAFYQLLK